ncbi:TIGR03086 family metal-binding protein [Streptomyces sp. NPDC059649]|uniref:TIGR03086 family metal-binding protein n=1 Tax=Streptomyces sp. NPDC059649 TaxID=3346895 RepID=UPI0036CD66CF
MHVDEKVLWSDEKVLWSIGEVAQKAGLSVKLIRHWSDTGIVPPARRTAAGYRLYDAESVARLELARTLRDLGLGLTAIRDVLDREHTLAEVAAVHVDALEAQIRTLRTQQAVLRSATRRATTAEGLAFMNRTARLSAAERRTIIHEFVTRTLADLDVPTYRRGLLAATPELPDDPTDEQVDAWIELSELVADPALHTAMRRMARYAAEHAPGEHDDAALEHAQQLTDDWTQRVREAMQEGIAPDSPAADPVIAAVVPAWLPTQTGTIDEVRSDGARARRLQAVGALVCAVDPSLLDRPTPCAGWDVRALLDHLVWENLMWASLAEGTPRSDGSSDHLGDDHIEAFRAAAKGTLTAFRRPGMLDQRYGPAPGRRLVEQLVMEMLVHGWDLAKAIGQPRDLVPDIAASALPVAQEIYAGLPRTVGGSFAPPQPVPQNATALDRLAAHLGRTVT